LTYLPPRNVKNRNFCGEGKMKRPHEGEKTSSLSRAEGKKESILHQEEVRNLNPY